MMRAFWLVGFDVFAKLVWVGFRACLSQGQDCLRAYGRT